MPPMMRPPGTRNDAGGVVTTALKLASTNTPAHTTPTPARVARSHPGNLPSAPSATSPRNATITSPRPVAFHGSSAWNAFRRTAGPSYSTVGNTVRANA